MILRIDPATAPEAATGQDAWQAFANSQQRAHEFAGCISQPTHASLAAQLAAVLNPAIFGALPPEVIEAIRRHDAGWAGSDLAALERVVEQQPQSFLVFPPKQSVTAWRRSIRQAEACSSLAGSLISRHFRLLAPRDGQLPHLAFLEQESQGRAALEAASSVSCDDLDRFTAALGFCDLLSLCLCSGLTGSVRIPLAHPADPASQHAPKVTVWIGGETLRFDQLTIAPNSSVHADGWVFSAPDVLASHRYNWVTE
jgi:hypothetical protein